MATMNLVSIWESIQIKRPFLVQLQEKAFWYEGVKKVFIRLSDQCACGCKWGCDSLTVYIFFQCGLYCTLAGGQFFKIFLYQFGHTYFHQVYAENFLIGEQLI